MRKEPKAVVDGQVEAFNARSIDEFISFYTPEAEILIEGELFAAGHDSIRAVYGTQFSSAATSATVLSRQCHGNWVIDHEHTTTPGQPPVSALVAYRINDGLIDLVNIMGQEVSHA